MGPGDDSAVKTTGYSCQGLGFYPPWPHAGSKHTVTIVPGDPMPSLTAIGTRHMHCVWAYIQAKHTCIK